MKKLKITVFADPVCTWCWGSAPVLRAVDFLMGDKVEVEYVMGCMIDDITKYSNRRLGIGGDIELSNRNIHKAWCEASSVHGMPVCEHGFRLFSNEHRSTAPQNLAYITATIYNEKAGAKHALCSARFLRRLQEATAVDALLTCDAGVIADLSATLGYEPSRFKDIMQSREVQRIFDDGKERMHHYDVHSFPTYLLQYKGTEMLLRGFTTFETLVQNIKQLTYGKVLPAEGPSYEPSVDNVKQFVERYGAVYPVEIATAFGMQRVSGKSALNVESYVGLPDILEQLVAKHGVALKPRGKGFVVFVKGDAESHAVSLEGVPVEHVLP